MESAVHSSAEGRLRVFADTSYFSALLSTHDSNHDRAVEISQEVAHQRLNVYTTWDVVVETATLLRYRAGFESARIFLTEVTPDLILVHPLETERQAAI